MAHIPINHHLQPVYRALAGLIGLYLIAFGVVNWLTNGLGDLFISEGGETALGIRGNGGSTLLALALGVIVLLGAVIGGNVDHHINVWVGSALLVIGTLMLALLRTDLNVLGFSLATVIVMYLLGMLLLAAGLYGKVGSSESADEEEAFRHAS
ncbi:MAG: DUF4383 domain-containing protein [Longispora sp.]|nr:DUF4383 domain-containing protein [Longispora sp. (in: high G+C Gram-positive bacteria)]